MTVVLAHNKVRLALHPLRDSRGGAGDGRAARPLLHLHGLGERSPAVVPDALATWPGPVWALDLTGHGDSSIPAGGGYSCEVLMADADTALSHLGPATVYGRGLGGYVALLLAGARPEQVRGAVIDDGPGLTGGGVEPGTPFIPQQPFEVTGPPDPYALLELSIDIRPSDYATTFARLAATESGLDVSLAVAARVRPPWLAAVAQEPGVAQMPVAEALALFAAAPD